MTNGRRVVVTGVGAVTPFGVGRSAYWTGLAAGRSGASLISSFDASELPTRFAGQVLLKDEDIDRLVENQKSLKTLSRAGKFGVIAAEEAFAESGLEREPLDPYRVGTSLGAGGLGAWDLEQENQMLDIIIQTLGANRSADPQYARIWRNTLDNVHPLTPLKALSNIPTAHIAINYNARGHCQTITTACTSSAQAIGEAYRVIRQGIADVMITGGSDSMINPNALVAFSMLGVLSRNNDEYRTASRPFDRRRDGFMPGEGCAVFTLEDLEFCRKRGGTPFAEIIGYASTCDAYRLTDEPPDAWGSVQAMRFALQDAKLDPERVDYVNAHGTGTPMNDKTETSAIKQVFGNHAFSMAISSTKSMIGHLVAAAGAVEFAACVLAMRHQCIPPTINYEEPDPECDLDYVPNKAREARLNIILSNSFGFGGQNACLVIRKPDI